MTSCAVEIERKSERFRIYAHSGLPPTPELEGIVSDWEMPQKWVAMILDDVQPHIFFKAVYSSERFGVSVRRQK
jgi:hypothetical protein